MSAQAAIEQARDADWQAAAAVAGVLIGLSTLVAAAAAAYFAKRAAEHTQAGAAQARRQAEEAIEANKIARQHALPLVQVHYCKWSTDEAGKELRAVEYGISNHGATPARDVQLYTEFAIPELPLPQDDLIFRFSLQAPMQVRNIASRTSIELTFPLIHGLLRSERENSIRAGTHAFVVRLTISYFDIWGDQHSTDAEWLSTGADFDKGEFQFVHNLIQRQPPRQKGGGDEGRA